MWVFMLVSVALGASNRKPFREPMAEDETREFGVDRESILTTKIARLRESVNHFFERNLVSRKARKTVTWREPIVSWSKNRRIEPTVAVGDKRQGKELEATDSLNAVKDLWDSFTRKEKLQFVLGSVIVLLGLYIFFSAISVNRIF